MTKLFSRSVLAALSGLLLFSSCSKDDDAQAPQKLAPGVYYIVNEGNFGSGNGNITLLDYRDTANMVTKTDIFNTVNNRALGDVVQSLAFSKGKGFVVVNGSGKIEVVDSATFTSVATISTIESPRYVKAVNAEKAYVTDWGSNAVQIVNLTDYSVTGTIPTATGPEQILLVGQKAYVSNTGGFGNDSVITVINTATNTAEASIRVGIKPSAMVLDKNGKIWVLCTGQYGFGGAVDKGGELVRINPATNQVEDRIAMASATDHPTVMATNPARDMLYFALNDKVYRLDVNSDALPANAFISEPGKYFYGLAVSPQTGNIVVTESEISADGQVYIYDNAGQLIGSAGSGGAFPNGAVIR